MQKKAVHTAGDQQKEELRATILISNHILRQGETVLACRTVGPEPKQRQVLYEGEGKTKLVPISHEKNRLQQQNTYKNWIDVMTFYVPMLRI